MPNRAFNAKLGAAARNRHRIGRVSLQLDRFGTGILGGANDLYRLVKILMMIRRNLGNHIDRIARSDRSLPDFNLLGHASILLQTNGAYQFKRLGCSTSDDTAPSR